MKDSTNPVGGKDKKEGDLEKDEDDASRVFRGGVWYNDPSYVRASSRSYAVYPTSRYNIGFRLVKNKGKP